MCIQEDRDGGRIFLHRDVRRMSADQECRVELKGAKFAHVIGSADALLAACVVEDLSIS
jgi:hypothetical protein